MDKISSDINILNYCFSFLKYFKTLLSSSPLGGIGGLILLSFSLTAQVTVRTQLDTNYMLIGDRMRLQVQVNSNSELKKVEGLIDQIDTSGTIEILTETPWQKQAGSYLKSYTFTAFDSGYCKLLPLPVAYQSEYNIDTVYSNTLGFMIDNPRIDSTLADIKPIIKEPTTFEDYVPYLIGLGILLILAGLIWYFFFRKKEEVIVETPVIIRPAHEIALEKLSGLKSESLWQKGSVKEYYSQLTYIFREYLENRFDIQALESTSEQIISQLEKKDFDAKMNDDVRRVLQSADLVKFAKAKPIEEFHVESFEKLEAFVKTTKVSASDTGLE